MNEHELEKSAEALNETENPAPVAEEVETDALTDALDTLAKAMNKDSYKKAEMDAKPDMDEEDMKKGEDMDKAEMDAEDMDKADMEESKDAEESDDDFIDLEEMMKEMADNTDRIVSEMKEDIAALLKGVEALLGEIKAMKAEQKDMNKSLNAVANPNDFVGVNIMFDGKLTRRDNPFGFVTNVEKNLVAVNLYNSALNKVTIIEELDGFFDRG